MRLVLIDCENLTGRHQVAAGFRWRGVERIETFGRAGDLARWRRGLARWGRVADAETVIADDAPSQAADLAIGRRVEALLAAGTLPQQIPPCDERGSSQGGWPIEGPRAYASVAQGFGETRPATEGPFRFVIIASNDSDFDPDIARLIAAGIDARRAGDPRPPELLALVVADLAVDGWTDAGPVGERLARDFALPLKGRLAALAAAAGLTIRRDPGGRLKLAPLRTDFHKP